MNLRAIALIPLAPALIHAQAPTPLPDPSLTPPGTPDNNVFKTLDQVEPRIPVNTTNTPGDSDTVFIISKPGSYYLTNNIHVTDGKSAVHIEAPSVALDLNGFRISSDKTGTKNAIFISALGIGSVIRNGTVSGWGGSGIHGIQSEASTVESVFAIDNGNDGIYLSSGSRVARCTAVGNGDSGINVNSGTIRDCIARTNTKNGIALSGGGTIVNCHSEFNLESGVWAQGAANITGCFVGNNKQSGITVNVGAAVTNNVCRSNKGTSADAAGILLGGRRNRIEGNHCTLNNIGIKTTGSTAEENFVARNTCAKNETITFALKNFDIQNNNQVGIIITPATGSSSSSGLGSANAPLSSPWANFSY